MSCTHIEAQQKSLRISGTFPATEGTARITGPAAKAASPHYGNCGLQTIDTENHEAYMLDVLHGSKEWG